MLLSFMSDFNHLSDKHIGGWFLTKIIVVKVEYLVQNYNDYAVGDKMLQPHSTAF